MKLKTKILTAALVAGLSASASAITYDAAIDGTYNPGGTFSANGNSLVVSTAYGSTYLGISGGMGGSEIGLNEKLTINLNKPGTFEYIIFAALYDGPEFGDLNEVVAAVTDASGTVYTLTANTANTATWTGFGGATVTNLSLAASNNAGVWKVENPFGNAIVGEISLYPLSSNPGGNEADFGLVGFSVPDSGASITMLALGLSVLVFFRRKQ